MISAIQTSLQLLGNASVQNTIDQRKAILTQMNSQLKGLVRDADFKEATPLLFGDNSATLAKERLEAAAALKTLNPEKQPQWDIQRGHPQKYKGGCGGGSHYNRAHTNQGDGNPAAANLP